MTSISTRALLNLDEKQFRLETIGSIFAGDGTWARFLDEDIIDRTRRVLGVELHSLDESISAWGSENQIALRKATDMRRAVRRRLKDVAQRIRALNREHAESVDAVERRWKDLAFRLVGELLQSDRAASLERLTVDPSGRRGDSITVAEWYSRRSNQQSSKKQTDEEAAS